VRRGIGHDSRIGFSFLFPGAGYGGSCFPKDVRAMVNMADAKGLPARMMRAVDAVNEAQKEVLPHKILAHFGGAGGLKGKTVAVWGLAFKPRTDDVREAPALVLIDALLGAGAAVCAHDPEAMPNVRALYGDRVRFTEHPYQALHDADALVIATEWNEFRNPDFVTMKRLMRAPVIFDGRNLYDPRRMASYGFTYEGIGRAHAG
jgi:UDPglucose 6-dehydrogenase